MLSRQYIKNMTREITYQKGKRIYQAEDVWEFSVEEDGGFDFVDAMVKGSGKSIYHVGMDIDREENQIENYECECPAFFSYDGPCKHCVAVMLEYLEHTERQMTIQDYLKKQQESLKKLQGIPKGIKKITTPQIKALLQKKTQERTLPVLQKETFGKVVLEPLLYCDRESVHVEFRIGITQKYVMKDVFSFIENMKSNAVYRYGKKLEFLHNEKAFAPDSRALLEFIQGWVENNRERYVRPMYQYGYGYSTSLPKVREIPLDRLELENFLDAVGEREIWAGISGSMEQKWRLAQGELERKLKISGNTQGIELALEGIYGCECSHSYVYFKDGEIYRIEKDKLGGVGDFIVCMENQPQKTAFIQKEDISLFCRELLPALKKELHCEMENFTAEEYDMPAARYSVYLDAPQRNFITCRAVAAYGESEYSVYDHETDLQKRDMAEEMKLGELVSSYCNAFDEKEKYMVLSDDDELLYDLLTTGIPRMQELAEVYVSDALKRIRVIERPKVSVGISLSGDLLELKMASDDLSKEQLAEILSKYTPKKKFYRLKNGEFLYSDGPELKELTEFARKMEISEKKLLEDKILLPKYHALYVEGELKGNQEVRVEKNSGFRHLIRNMTEPTGKELELPEELKPILREYQVKGFRWLKTLKQNGFGGILADDMGLGKTLQVIAFLLSEYRENPKDTGNSLIVAPASLVYNWKKEIERFAPELSAVTITQPGAERKRILQELSGNEILITSYDLLKRDKECYGKKKFFCLIIDEAQYIKNHGTQAAKAVKAVNSGMRLALTGTPVENRLSELWSIFDYLMPGFLYSYRRFREELEIPIVQNQDEEALERLQKLIAPFVLRRIKGDVLKDLPEKQEEERYVELSGEQRKLYDAHVKRIQMLLDKKSDEELKNSKIQILAELTRLRQICCHPALLFEDYKGESAKEDMCINMVKSAVESGHKILLFSQFTTMLERLEVRMSQEGIGFHTLTGAVSKEKRADMVESFNHDDIPVFCISLKAGGTGLNLTSADIVIHYDPWWNLAVQNQATDRAHRIGQKNVVNVYKLITKGTIEENIIRLQERKRELADKILSGQGMERINFSKEEIMELLSL